MFDLNDATSGSTEPGVDLEWLEAPYLYAADLPDTLCHVGSVQPLRAWLDDLELGELGVGQAGDVLGDVVLLKYSFAFFP